MQLTDKVDPNRGAAAAPLSTELRANRFDVLSRLAEDLAHEIKNPLNAIVVNLELLRRRVANGAADAALDRASVIEHEIKRVHSLVDQLLQLLRPARAEGTTIAVDAVVESLTPALQIQANAANVGWSCTVESGLYARIRNEALKFALLNLTVHAIDSEKSAGGAVSVDAKRAGGEIYITVKCTHALLNAEDDDIRMSRLLIESAGGALESVEPTPGESGSTATLVMSSGGLA